MNFLHLFLSLLWILFASLTTAASLPLTSRQTCTYGQYECAPGDVSFWVCAYGGYREVAGSCGEGEHCDDSTGSIVCLP
ncbi:uncharacterized protein LY89DRAFT_689443, partial [Mollisia scopiformis]